MHTLGTPGEQRGGIQQQRELQQLRGLKLQRPGAEPAARPVDAHAEMGDVHGEHEHERDRQQRADHALHPGQPIAREHAHQHQADRPVDEELDQVGAAGAAALEQGRGRGGAVDHHRPERQQA